MAPFRIAGRRTCSLANHLFPGRLDSAAFSSLVIVLRGKCVGHNWADSVIANRRQNKGLWCPAVSLTTECSTIELPGTGWAILICSMSGTNRFAVYVCRRSAAHLIIRLAGQTERPRASFGPPLTVLELKGSAEEWRVFATPLLRTEGLRTSGPALQVEWPRVHSLAGAGCHLTKIHMAGYRSRATKRMCHVWAFKMGNH